MADERAAPGRARSISILPAAGKKQALPPLRRRTMLNFSRRVWLDLAGKLPPPPRCASSSPAAVPTSASRRSTSCWTALAMSTNFAAFWRDALIPEAPIDGQFQQLMPAFDLWLQRHLARDTSFDQIVREVLTTPLVAPQPANPQTRRAASPFGRAVLRGQADQPGQPGRRHEPRLPGHPRGVRPVPRPSVRSLEAAGVLGLRFVLRRPAATRGRPPGARSARSSIAAR